MTQETPAISWRPDFATGVAIIDDQHKVLINMLNDASTKLNDRSPLEDFSRIVQALLSYTGYHFGTEEKLMVEHGYADASDSAHDKHLSQHKAFVDKVVSVQASLKAGQRVPKADLVNFLTAWLADHILNTDRKLGRFICDHQAASGQR
jgi:hemerythrin-like metal-binding protein